MNRRGGSDCRRKATPHIEECHSLTQREHHQPRSPPSPINASGSLKDFGDTRIDVRCTVENATTLLNSVAPCVRQMMIPTRIDRTKAAELTPTRWVRPGREINTRQRSACRENQRLRINAPQRRDARRFRKLRHLRRSHPSQIARDADDHIDGTSRHQPLTWTQRCRIALQLQIGLWQHEPIDHIQRK